MHSTIIDGIKMNGSEDVAGNIGEVVMGESGIELFNAIYGEAIDTIQNFRDGITKNNSYCALYPDILGHLGRELKVAYKAALRYGIDKVNLSELYYSVGQEFLLISAIVCDEELRSLGHKLVQKGNELGSQLSTPSYDFLEPKHTFF